MRITDRQLILTAFIFIFTSVNGKAQAFLDSVYPGLIALDEVVFSDSNERKLFESDFSKLTTSEKFTALSRTKGPQSTVGDGKWFSLISNLKSIKRHKKNEKYIDNIYKEVHNTLLQKYKLQTSFDEVFTEGAYNCVTASSLYALVFDELAVPYELKELPSHVYIIAFPTEQIVVESTNPKSGFYTIDDNYKNQYVSDLIENKMVSSAEASQSTVDEIFDHFYFNKEKSIEFRQLLGLQYYNQGVYHMQNKEYRKAIEELEKATYLYPSGGCAYNLLISMAKVLDNTDYKGNRDIIYLARMTRMPNEFELSDDHVLGAFSKITSELLISKGEKASYDSIYAELTGLMVHNDSVKNKVDLIYNFETARYYSLSGEYEKSIPHAINALKGEPTNLQTQVMVTELLRAQFLAQYKRDEVDTNVIEKLVALQDSVPEIWKNARFKQLYIDLFAAVIGVYVEQGEQHRCLKLLENLEALADENELLPEQQITSYICSEVAKYYFRKGSYGNARKAAKLGLKYYPNDGMLQAINRQLR